MAEELVYIAPKIEIDFNRHQIRVGDFVYSIDALAGGFVTKPGEVCRLFSSEPDADGARTLCVQVWRQEIPEPISA